MKRTMAMVAMLVLAAVPAFAQGDSISAAVKQAWAGAKRNIAESAEQMPEADYAFKPVDSVRTFGQILAHVAGANYVFCAAAMGEKPPHAEDEFEKSAKTKAEITKAVNESIAYCDAKYNALTDASAAKVVDLPFGMGKGAAVFPLIANTGHNAEHYGNLVTYFRIKGMVPPSSKRGM
jgi:uncharacterized damage-inducible protein DinB